MSTLTEAQQEILTQRRIATVATIDRNGFPHMTAVWFYFDGESFWIAIPSSSAKAKNLNRNGNMAIMIDARVPGQELGVTAQGVAAFFTGDEASEMVAKVHEKYITPAGLDDPEVGPAFAAFDDLAVRLTPEKWISWDMGALDQAAFGGKLGGNGYLHPVEN